jgi:hypothetical protein
VGYTFQPAQIDLGPDPEAQPEGGGLLTPETQRSMIVGMKADGPGGKVGIGVDAFFVNFYNQPVRATSGGTTVLRSIGEQRYTGIDVEGVKPAFVIRTDDRGDRQAHRLRIGISHTIVRWRDDGVPIA